MEPVPPEKPRVFGKDYQPVVGQCRTLLKKLVGIHNGNL
jgi:hypothetical protein